MPGHVLRIPPRVLQALPEEARLPDPANLVPPRDNSLFAILHDELAQRVHQIRPQLLEPLVVRPQRKFRQRFLQAGSRLLAVNPKRPARGSRVESAAGGSPVKRRDVPVVRKFRNIIQIIQKVSHVFK